MTPAASLPVAAVCEFCRRAIQKPGPVGWWEDAGGGLSCSSSSAAHGGHEPDRRHGWTVPEGWRFDSLGQCRTCRASVAWCWTPAGNRAPVNADGISHFATCPQADEHRRRNASRA